MSVLVKILGGLVALIAIVFALGFVLPGKSHVERSTVIAAAPEMIYPYLSDFENFNAWSPWAARDPDAKYTITGAGVGQKMSWTSDKPEVGSGSQEITALEAPHLVRTRLDFGEQGVANGAFTLSPYEGGTKVVWSLDADMREGVPVYMQPVATYMGFFMDGMVGPDFEKGLENLKTVVED